MYCNVMSYLYEAARACPDRLALADRRASYTYARLLSEVKAMGSALAARCGAQNRPVVVALRHSADDVRDFLAAAYSGNCCVPVDPTLPAERLRAMLDVVRPCAVIADKFPLDADAARSPVWTEEELLAAAPGETGEAPWTRGKDTDPLYIMFTSGSTGEPKGVAISHRSVIDMVEQFTAVFQFPEGSVFGNQAPFDFDVSVKDIYLALRVHGTVEILEKQLFSFPKLLLERLRERRVDTAIWAVPALKVLCELDAFADGAPQTLKNVMFSGEVMPQKTLSYWMNALPEARFVNLYGPTEITCNCTYYVVERNRRTEDAVPIGRAFPNCSVFLADGGERVTQEGRTGELCVSGSCLALGYYRRRELTDAAFVQIPWQDAYPERMYRTGDLGCMKDGLLYYMGRADTQIKHMGHRVEMTEIELCANAARDVSVSACVYDQKRTRLVLFYQGAAAEKELREHLRERLPKYMLPAVLRRVEEFPRTRTGKIDRRALLAAAQSEK
ncbi:MAG: amino acid adenylation domain-containing protein [Oscillospiraceae bacterium]|nr:amino acid adenylation domain-containing protein [Oscillospiraceae bacterium]